MALHPVHRLEPADVAIVIRPARAEDASALLTLAALDSRALPAAPILVAEPDGVLRAALSLFDGAVIADPFDRTAPLAALLNARAEQLRAEPPAAGVAVAPETAGGMTLRARSSARDKAHDRLPS